MLTDIEKLFLGQIRRGILDKRMLSSKYVLQILSSEKKNVILIWYQKLEKLRYHLNPFTFSFLT